MVIREAQPSDVDYLAPRLRQADVRGLQAGSGSTPLQALQRGYTLSVPRCTIIGNQGQPVAMFGVVPWPNDNGLVWLLATDDLSKRPLLSQFLRDARKYVGGLHNFYPRLILYTDEGNTVLIKWLTQLGFEVCNRIPEYGVEKRPYLTLERTRSLCVTPPQSWQ